MSWAKTFKLDLPEQPEPIKADVKYAEVDWSRVVTIDFETYFSTEYTLKKLSTSEYIRDSRFKAQMMGIKVGKGRTRVIPTHRIQKVLNSIDWSTHALLCHNTAFDGFILSHHYGVVPSFYYDTLSMARGLHSNEIDAGLNAVAHHYGKGSKLDGVLGKTKGVLDWPQELFDEVAEYCRQDVDLCHDIFADMTKVYPADEMALIDLTIRMFCDPVLKVDIPRVEKEHLREVERRKTLFYDAVPPELYDVDGDEHDEELFFSRVLKTKKERLLEGEERRLMICQRLLGNNEFFANLLRNENIEPPVKESKAWLKRDAERDPTEDPDDTGRYAYAFSKDDLDFINLPEKTELWIGSLDVSKKDQLQTLLQRQERIRTLINARLAVKSTTNITRAERFLTAGKNGMPLPVGYSYYRAHTGRWGGNNKMNMQNLTRGGELRLSVMAPDGYQMCVVDSGQIEARVNAWLWGEKELLKAFRSADTWDKSKGVARGESRDAYCRFADKVYNREITTEDKLERFVGKVCVLGLGFQMGPAKLRMTLAKGALGGPPVYFSDEECRNIVNQYRSSNAAIRKGWSTCADIIGDMVSGRKKSHKCLHWEKERIWLPNGMSLKYPDLESKDSGEDDGFSESSYRSGKARTKIYGGLLCENIVQALARIIVADQMLRISQRYRVVMTTHDEVVAMPRTEEADECFAYMTECMSTPPAWCADIPLNCEGGYAQNYSK